MNCYEREVVRMFGHFSSTPGGFQFFFILIAAIVIGGIISVIVHGTHTWIKNNNSPFETVDAQVVAKRHHVTGSESSTSTTYYVTFEMENGERKELHVSGKEYGLLAEGDRGRLSHQGTRYKGFERTI